MAREQDQLAARPVTIGDPVSTEATDVS